MSDEGERTCPLCAEEMDLTDQQLKPCKCGYQICVWCWHHILDMAEKDDTEGRCPACRSPYDKEKIVGTAANCERLVAESVERKKSQKAKTKPSEGRKQLSSVRVIQRNLVYIVGLPLDLADEYLLQRREYFGQYGRVLKVSMSRTAAGVIQQFPNNTCSVYITYSKEEEAIRCIQSVHGFVLDGRSLKACFGTTKYCHAWLRNVPCTNSDCLYLHEIGSQEDSFTKDEIISAYTRSRVQQITSGTNNMPRCSGSTLPPPVDDYCVSISASAAKPIGKNISNNTMSNDRSSPLNGSSCGSIALPAAASWAMRASSQSKTTSSLCSDVPIQSKVDKVASTLDSSFGTESRAQVLKLHSNGENRPTLGRSQDTNGKDTGNNEELNVLKSLSHARHFTAPEKEGSAATDGNIEKLSLRVDYVSTEFPSIAGTISSPPSDQGMINLPLNQTPLKPYVEPCREPLTSPAIDKTVASKSMLCAKSQNFNWRIDPQTQAVTSAGSELEDVITSFGNQRIKDSEAVLHTCGLAQSANSVHIPNHSSSHLLHNDSFSPMSVNADPLYVDKRVSDSMLLSSPGISVISNELVENLISSSAIPDRNANHSILHPNKRELKHMRRLASNADSSVTLDVGESSIISNILSLEVDTRGDSLTSPQALVKLFGDNDKQRSSLKLSSSWKVHNNNQSRFSFARQEESRSQAFDNDSSLVFLNLHKNSSVSHDSGDNSNSYFDKPVLGNSFSSSFDEPDIFSSHPSSLSSNMLSAVSRAQISAPPGFSIPNRVPPPGFSSHERMDQTFNNMTGNHFLDSSSLPRNSYQPQSAGNMGSTTDIEFIDPAILAVGKGRLEAGFNNSILDSRSHFPQQLSALENEAKRQLLMQRSFLTHQNLRYNDMGDRFSSASDSYGFYSRLVDQSPVGNLDPFAQLSLQQPRNGLMLNGHWEDGWNEVRDENSMGMTELLRNERLGFNRFLTSGYEDSKFRMPNSGDLYNRTFEM